MWTIWFGIWLGSSVTDAQGPSQEALAQALPSETQPGPARRKSGKRRSGGMKTLQGGTPLKRDIRSGAVAPLPGGFSELNLMLKKGRFRQAALLASTGLDADPLDADLHAAKAVASAHFGDYPGAMVHLQDALGSSAVEVLSVVARADIERYLGDPHAGVELRRGLLAIGARPKREISLVSNVFADYAVAGDVEAMWDTAWEAAALAPTSPVGHALLAQAYMAQGDLESAEFHLWMGDQSPDRSLTLQTARIEVYRAAGLPEVAVTESHPHRRTVFRSVEFTAARSLALSEMGDPESALDAVDLQTWSLGGEMWHPDVLGAQAVAYAGLGWHDHAQDVAARLRSTYPDYAPARRAIAAVEAMPPAP